MYKIKGNGFEKHVLSIYAFFMMLEILKIDSNTYRMCLLNKHTWRNWKIPHFFFSFYFKVQFSISLSSLITFNVTIIILI